MSAPGNPLTLADWRRSVAAMYADVRRGANLDGRDAASTFRAARDALMRSHSESPITVERRQAWRGVDWYPFDPAWRVVGRLDTSAPRQTFEISLATDGILRCTRVGHVRFRLMDNEAALAVYWLEGYGGGIWLPFADATNGTETYGGGRYLYDTIKGADLGVADGEIVLDFNYAYNPSCAYDERWSCPLSPPENRLPFAVTAGERLA